MSLTPEQLAAMWERAGNTVERSQASLDRDRLLHHVDALTALCAHLLNPPTTEADQ